MVVKEDQMKMEMQELLLPADLEDTKTMAAQITQLVMEQVKVTKAETEENQEARVVEAETGLPGLALPTMMIHSQMLSRGTNASGAPRQKAGEILQE